MAHVRQVKSDEASGLLKRIYDEAIARAGKVWGILRVQSLNPAALDETDWLRKLVKAAFSQRRKQLRNAWSRVLPSPRLAEVAARAGIDLERRGETLSVAEFGRVADEAARP